MFEGGPDPKYKGKLPETPEAKKVIMFAFEESNKQKNKVIDTGHLLLGLMRDTQGKAARILIWNGL